jgi:hypothetical protein
MTIKLWEYIADIPKIIKNLAVLSGEGFLYLADETVTAIVTGDWENITNIPNRIKRLIELSAADGAIFLDTNGDYRVVPFGVGTGKIAEGDHSHSTLPSLGITGDVVSTSPTTGSLLLDGIGMGGGNMHLDRIYFGTQTGQMINLFGDSYGVGVQSWTVYMRTRKNFAWFVNGSHNGLEFANPGGYLAFKYDGGMKAFTFNDTTAATSKTSGAVIIGGGVGISGDIFCSKIIPDDGASGVFTTVDGKTISVTNGIITGII